LHFGSLVAAMASHADARAAGGAWLLRIEDIDVPRIQPGAEQAIVAALAAHGLAPDAPVVRQSARTERYRGAVDALVARGLAYPCACTRRELEAAPLHHGERVYPGTCSAGVAATRSQRRQRSLRVRVPDEPVCFVDRVQGPQAQALRETVGDFVVRRADGWFAYQLAVVVDDAAQEITSVVRGADLLSSTPRQIALQRMLGLPTPAYLHVPVAVDADGRKLSKQTGALPLGGDPVPSLLRAWAFLGQLPPLATPCTVAEFWAYAARAWRVASVPPVPMLPAPTSPA
jgi:glutamyl-Q tRNA(Asp) synthetase